MARRKKKRRIAPEELHPDVAKGLAQGREEIIEDARSYRRSPAGVEVVAHMRDVETVIGSRVPLPKFVGEVSSSDMITEFADGRAFHDVRKTFGPDTLRAMREGLICLKCLEPQAHAFEDVHLPGCEGVALHGPSYMRDRQIMDIAMEFEGEHHIGPSKPIKEYLLEQDLRQEKRAFEASIIEGGSRGRRVRAS